jgi:phosphoenolpyruvate carboxylase
MSSNGNRSPREEKARVPKDRPLNDEIRLLGRFLGDVVRNQEGQAVFDLIETIRRTSVRFHREDDLKAKRDLENILLALDPSAAVQVIRAFSYFSHLANIAEDHHHIRRARHHAIARSKPRRGTIANALSRAFERGHTAAEIKAFFDHAQISPVLTAHPTEVRRRSMMHQEMAIADLVAQREREDLIPAERQDIEDRLAGAVLVLWQTNLLRQTRLDVLDEATNGLSYFYHTFFRELPRLYSELEDRLADADGQSAISDVASFLTIGSWIGGDRDGNPFVDASVLREIIRQQSFRALGFYLEEVNKLGNELPLSSLIVGVSPELSEFARLSPDTSPHREVEPYRRALAWIYARLAATQLKLNSITAPVPPAGIAAPYASAQDLQADLRIIHDSLVANGSLVLTQGRLRHLRRAVDCFGFHLARLDLRQNSDVHVETVGELLEVAEPGTGFAAMEETSRRERLCSELRSRRPLILPRHPYTDKTAKELAIFDAALEGLST